MSDPVLVGVALDDRDADPVALGAALALLTGGRVALVHAYPHGASLGEQERVALQRLAAALSEDLEVTLHAYAGDSPARALQAAAESLEAAAVVLGSTHRGRAGRVFAGGVGERLLHGAPCPVAIAPLGYADRPAGLGEIGVAFDARPEARSALAAAIELARAGGGEVTTYTATASIEPGVALPPGNGAARRDGAERIVESARELVPGAVRGGFRLVTGDAAAALAEASAGLDLLVCGSRGYGPLRAVLLGGVSAALARGAGCPLLVVPRGDSERRASAERRAGSVQQHG